MDFFNERSWLSLACHPERSEEALLNSRMAGHLLHLPLIGAEDDQPFGC
jgi:hypothetical protein